jgi:hypothetical protein
VPASSEADLRQSMATCEITTHGPHPNPLPGGEGERGGKKRPKDTDSLTLVCKRRL